MIFKMGRKDAENEGDISPPDRLPDANEPKSSIISKM